MLFPTVGSMPLHEVSPERRIVLAAFEKAHALRFRDLRFLNLAFCHRSFGNEAGAGAQSNERLEFLGDSVLGLVVATWLFEELPGRPEGDLARIKSHVVSEESLSQVALRIGVDELLLIGKGEEMSGGRKKKAILADATEAIIGAIYVDQGLTAAQGFVLGLLVPHIRQVLENRHAKDYKTLLQEFSQKHLKIMPRYVCISKTGPDHARTYGYEVFLGEEKFGAGSGGSKKEAEQQAAGQAWERLCRTSETARTYSEG